MTRSWSTRTSGDLMADRRFAWGDGALQQGDLPAARDLFEQAREQAPHWPPAHYALGKACHLAGDDAAARDALERVLALDPEDLLGAGLLLAKIEGRADKAAMPDHFVAALFDEYAPRFDHHLVESLSYRAPAVISSAIGRYVPRPPQVVYDLGCGTGLMAQALPGQGQAQWYGVDLSAAMLAEAEKTGCYTALETGALLGWLEGRLAATADLVLAADVFCYVPDLAPVFRQVARVLRAGGHFAFTIQTYAGEGVIVGADMRVHHAPALILALADEAGLRLIESEPVSTRKDRGVDVPGAVFLLGKA